MVKILSQSGRSISDVYDVEGSIVRIEQLASREVTLVHEMGATIFSERLSGVIRRGTQTVTQNTAFLVELTDLPSGITRILGITVFTDNAARILRAGVILGAPVGGREIPIWVWDGSNSSVVVFSDNGAARANHNVLEPQPSLSQLPSLLIGAGQPQRVQDIVLTGLSTGFGAGTVILTFVIYVGFSEVGGLSSRGLPVPGW